MRFDESRLEALLKLDRMAESPLQEITEYCLEEAVRLTKSQIGFLAFLNADESILTTQTAQKLRGLFFRSDNPDLRREENLADKGTRCCRRSSGQG